MQVSPLPHLLTSSFYFLLEIFLRFNSSAALYHTQYRMLFISFGGMIVRAVKNNLQFARNIFMDAQQNILIDFTGEFAYNLQDDSRLIASVSEKWNIWYRSFTQIWHLIWISDEGEMHTVNFERNHRHRRYNFFFLHFTLQFIKFRWKRFKWKWICFGLEWDENVEQLDKIFQLIELRILLVHTKRNIRGSESRVLSLIISFWSWNRLNNINVPLLSKSSRHYHHPNEPDCVFHFHFICFYVVFLFCDTCCCIWIDWTDNIDFVDDRRPTRDDGILNNNIKTTK